MPPMSPVPRSTFAATGIVVSDLDRSVAFYRDVFGMEEQRRVRVGTLRLDEAILVTSHGAGGSLVLMKYEDEARRHVDVGQKLVFYVSDPSATATAVRAAGGRVTFEPTALPEFGATIGFVQDPDGHSIEVLDTPVAGAG